MSTEEWIHLGEGKICDKRSDKRKNRAPFFWFVQGRLEIVCFLEVATSINGRFSRTGVDVMYCRLTLVPVFTGEARLRTLGRKRVLSTDLAPCRSVSLSPLVVLSQAHREIRSRVSRCVTREDRRSTYPWTHRGDGSPRRPPRRRSTTYPRPVRP